jgi:PPOX class probable F420-dependent enzyme
MDAHNLAELYDLETLEWPPIKAVLDRGGLTQAPDSGGPNRHTCWLATIDADGKPHLSGVGARWADDAWWFETGQTSRKGRNLARDPRCTLSVAVHDFDLVVEGRADIVTDPGAVAACVAAWRTEGWPCEVDRSGTGVTAAYSAPSAGPPPWQVYRLSPASAMVLQTVEPGGATRFTF